MQLQNSLKDIVLHSGNEGLFKLLQMSSLTTYLGYPQHIHAEGLRGTGKTTLMRAMGGMLPEIERIKDCPYNCDPEHPHCPEHASLNQQAGVSFEREWIQMPFVEISQGAKLGTVVGSIDLKKITHQSNPEASVIPGALPRAHRGIVFVDEINRLADTSPELSDVLLDIMGTKPGKVQIEETGLEKLEMPVNLSLWAASNPDEEPGALKSIRKQLSDRFDYTVDVFRPTQVEIVEHILSGKVQDHNIQSIPFTQNSLFKSEKDAMPLNEIVLPDHLSSMLARIYVEYNLESLRAIKAVKMGAIASSLLRGNRLPDIHDIQEVLPYALKHRVSDEEISEIETLLQNVKESSRRFKPNGSQGHFRDSKRQSTHSKTAKETRKNVVADLFSRLQAYLTKPTDNQVTTTGQAGKSLQELIEQGENSSLENLVKEGKKQK